jgi:hypothetical protein
VVGFCIVFDIVFGPVSTLTVCIFLFLESVYLILGLCYKQCISTVGSQQSGYDFPVYDNRFVFLSQSVSNGEIRTWDFKPIT